MLKRTTFFFIVCFITICLSIAPAFADFFDFSIDRLDTTFDGTTFTAWLNKPFGIVTLNRIEAPMETVQLAYDYGSHTSTLGDFSLWMDLYNITAATATASGEFTLTEIDGDTITGDITGNWELIGYYGHFSGDIMDIQWTSDDGYFNGDSGSDDAAVPLDLVTLPPWNGIVVDLANDHPLWFTYPWIDKWGEIRIKPDTFYAVVPAPAAVFLGILGLGAVGIKLRKYA